MAAPIMLVTGGSRGIGAAIAVLGAQRGYDIAFTYARDGAAAAAVAEQIRAEGRQALSIQADMAREADVARTFEAVDSLGPLSAMVYNCGVTGAHSRLDEAEPATLREVLDVNLLGAMLCAREGVKRMSTRHGGAGGGIVFLSSRAAFYGAPNEFVWYAATKGGIDSLTVGLARELGQDGIRVNAVSPGPIATDMHRPGRLEQGASRTPMGRAGAPAEVAEAVLFLLSDAASYTTGANLSVAGGA